MRKGVILVLFLALFLLPIVNFAPYDGAPIIVAEPNMLEEFSLSADGDSSDSSITSFSETLPSDDTLFYPDLFDTNVVDTADAGEYTGSSEVNNWTYTQTKDASVWRGSAFPYSMNLTFLGPDNLRGFDYASYFTTVVESPDVEVWNFTGSVWVDLGDAVANSWFNGTLYDPDYWNSTGDIIIQVDCISGPTPEEAYWDYAEVQFYVMHLVDANHYAESFADVSEINATLGETVTTDNDLGTFHHPGDNAWDYYYWNAPSALTVQVIEWRTHANISSSSYEFALYSADDGGGSLLYSSGSITAPTSAGTKKYSPMVTGVESIRLATRHASSPAAFIFDYLRGSLSNETGICHDGSTTAGVTVYGGGTLGINATGLLLTSDADYSWFDIAVDTTTTASYLEPDYYPFLELEYSAGSVGLRTKIQIYSGSFQELYPDSSLDVATKRFNIRAATANDIQYIRILVGDSQTLCLKWTKAYSIANFTVTQGSTDTDEFLYVDSGVLTIGTTGETDYSYYFLLNHDPMLTVATATYNVWNFTVSSDNNYSNIQFNIGGWQGWEGFSETRGSLTSGTLSDLQIQIAESTDGATISAIEFIEDSTSPTVARTNVNPPEPTDDEQVTLSTIVFDTVTVYKVWFNAITYPAGFSDVDYEATLSGESLYTYDFTTLTQGYYAFKVIANDGANNNTIDATTAAISVVDFTVRESSIILEEITLIGAGDDFTTMTFSSRINKDCTYTIYEESENNPEQDTYSGSVSAPSFNLAWGKLDTTDKNVNFTIKFVNGSLTENYTSQYQVAQTTFYVEPGWNHNGQGHTVNITVNGRITKLATYTVYIDGSATVDGIAVGSGTVTSLDFEIEFPKMGAEEAWHNFAIKFTNGSQTCWANSTYYRWKYSPDRPEIGGAPDPYAYNSFQVGVFTLMTVVGIGVYVATQGSKEGNL